MSTDRLIKSGQVQAIHVHVYNHRQSSR